MKISRVRIENFRSIKDLAIELGPTTVFIGPNDSGKTAILDAVRIVLTRRWGQRGTGFTEHDVHRPEPEGDPRTLPAVRITLTFEEPTVGSWDEDMVAALNDIMPVLPDGRNIVTLRVTCAWNPEKEAFDPAWEFLDAAGQPMQERRRTTNLTGFFSYVPLFWLGPLRDASDEFAPRAGNWGRLLRSVRIPDDLEDEALQILRDLDSRIVASAPRLAAIADEVGQATSVAVGEGTGAARVNTLPMAVEDMLQRTSIVIRNEELRPWLPLSHHGQGLQSLAVIFLFQAAAAQHLVEAERPGTEPIFEIEEPEVHLHPQAARTLLNRIENLSGQKLITTHSPFFVQHVPLHDLRIACLRDGHTRIASLPKYIVSDLPWNELVDGLVVGSAQQTFLKDTATGRVAAQSWFDEELEQRLMRCYRRDADAGAKNEAVRRLRHQCRMLPTQQDEKELGFHGRRVRGEIFFARRWILVEGVTEYLLMHALAKAFGWPLDVHGTAVVDFQQSGNAAVYPALGEAFGIPWDMVLDGDDGGGKLRDQILKRGFREGDIAGRVARLDVPNKLEDQLVTDGHEKMLREILAPVAGASCLDCPADEFRSRLKSHKTAYMSVLSLRVSEDVALAERMPAPFVQLVKKLRDGGA